jgi:hypothetical protein
VSRKAKSLVDDTCKTIWIELQIPTLVVSVGSLPHNVHTVCVNSLCKFPGDFQDICIQGKCIVVPTGTKLCVRLELEDVILSNKWST